MTELRIFMLFQYLKFDELDNYNSTEDYFEEIVDNHIYEEIYEKEEFEEKVQDFTNEEYSTLRQAGVPKPIAKMIVGVVDI